MSAVRRLLGRRIARPARRCVWCWTWGPFSLAVERDLAGALCAFCGEEKPAVLLVGTPQGAACLGCYAGQLPAA